MTLKPIATLILLLSASPAWAAGEAANPAETVETIVPALDQEGRRGDIARLAKEKAQVRFDAADADMDGQLSREEVAQDANLTYLSQNFDKLDLDTNGFLSWEEYVGHKRWSK